MVDPAYQLKDFGLNGAGKSYSKVLRKNDHSPGRGKLFLTQGKPKLLIGLKNIVMCFSLSLLNYG